jgi:hypothetical protein
LGTSFYSALKNPEIYILQKNAFSEQEGLGLNAFSEQECMERAAAVDLDMLIPTAGQSLVVTCGEKHAVADQALDSNGGGGGNVTSERNRISRRLPHFHHF